MFDLELTGSFVYSVYLFVIDVIFVLDFKSAKIILRSHVFFEL